MTSKEKLYFPLICVFVTIVAINAAVVKVTMDEMKNEQQRVSERRNCAIFQGRLRIKCYGRDTPLRDLVQLKHFFRRVYN